MASNTSRAVAGTTMRLSSELAIWLSSTDLGSVCPLAPLPSGQAAGVPEDWVDKRRAPPPTESLGQGLESSHDQASNQAGATGQTPSRYGRGGQKDAEHATEEEAYEMLVA